MQIFPALSKHNKEDRIFQVSSPRWFPSILILGWTFKDLTIISDFYLNFVKITIFFSRRCFGKIILPALLNVSEIWATLLMGGIGIVLDDGVITLLQNLQNAFSKLDQVLSALQGILVDSKVMKLQFYLSFQSCLEFVNTSS